MERFLLRPLFPLLIFILCHFPSAVFSASTFNGRDRNYATDVNELTTTLLSHRDDPFAEEDKWSSLPSDALRQQWTNANRVVPSLDPISNLLNATANLRRSSISVHVDVQIVAPVDFITPSHHQSILHYATAMKAGRNGTRLNFALSLAPKQIFERVALHPPSENPANFTTFLDQAALSTGSINVLYVIVNPQDSPINNFVHPIPFLGRSRAAWFLYSVEKQSELVVTHLLVTTERAAERVFAPAPLYFPLPFIRDLQVSVTAYTPGLEHRAPWLEHFAWENFETAVRAHAIHGQTVRFVSAQTNAECKACANAFHDVHKPSTNFIQNSVKMLNHGVMPTNSWANSFSQHTRKQALIGTFHLYILDTSHVRKNEFLQRLERHSLFAFPGIAIIVIRTSDREAKANLLTTMLRAFVSGVFGVSDTMLYIPNRSSLGGVAKWSGAPAPVLTDLMSRNLVRSVIEQRIEELEEIVDGMVYFEVEPVKSLEERDFLYFSQTVNLIMYKMQNAQQAISNHEDCALGVYLVASTDHDIKAIRTAFDIEGEESTLMRFRDPTIRCHFSRLKREALRVSEIFESTYPSLKSLLLAASSFVLSILFTKALLWKLATWKSPRKRE